MAHRPEIVVLKRLGLSTLEAAVYCFLLNESPSSEGRIADATGATGPDIRRAIAALEAKGAITVDAGDEPICRAIPSSEFIRGTADVFEIDCENAEAALNDLYVPSRDHRVYQLSKVEQAIARGRAMIDGAEEIVLIDVTPGLADAFADNVKRAKARGVKFGAVIYLPHAAYPSAGAPVVLHDRDIFESWPGQHVQLCVDAAQLLMAFMSHACDEIIEGVWSGSAFLSSTFHAGMVAEIMAFIQDGRGAPGGGDLKSAAELTLVNAKPPGFRSFFDRATPRAAQPKGLAAREKFHIVGDD